jgi:hypothetical protein
VTDPCRLCGSPTDELWRLRILDRYDVGYSHCRRCDLIQTERPYWLDEAYTTTIAGLDTGAVARNLYCSRLASAVTWLLDLDRSKPCLDYGGGHGILTRMMRDVGWNFRWWDKYGPNLYAVGFEGAPDERHQIITAFEVLEHFVDVRDDLARIFEAGHDFVLVGTVLHARPDPRWWYLVPETGQHVAFFGRPTMVRIGATFGYRAWIGPSYSLFVRGDVRLSRWRAIAVKQCLRASWFAYGLGTLLAELGRWRSLTSPDHARLRGHSRDSQHREE